MQLLDAAGQPVVLGRELGKGGEGSVFEIPAAPNRVAKVYHQKVVPEKAAKLAAMAAGASESLTAVAAWPIGVLHAKPGREVRGLIMPRVQDHLEIHHLYGPAHRKQSFPKADWSFLLHAARNVAAAFATVHSAGHVIGDVNQGNVVVSAQATVRLIDCDSFQVRSNGSLYRCEVGVGHFTPPELQGKSFAGVERTANHDAFGLAVLLFHLLFMGRHPFAGRFLGSGHMPIEKAIEEFRFVFGASAGALKMEPPPHALPLSAASGRLPQLFERAFSRDGVREGARPAALEWTQALDELKGELRACARSSAHKHHRSLASCPWCAIERAGGPDFFIGALVASRAPSGFDLDAVWSEIAGVAPPPQHVSLPRLAPLNPPVITPAAGSAKSRVWAARLTGLGALLGIVLALFGVAGAGWAAVVLGVLWLGFTPSGAQKKEIEARRNALKDAERQRQQAEERWHTLTRTTLNQFHGKSDEMVNLRAEYAGLAEERRQGLSQLHANRQSVQLRRYLERFHLDRADIRGIGAGRKATLASYGIETAADITPGAIMAIPGFGPSLSSSLVAWRRSRERGFRFNPSEGVSPAEIAALDRGLDSKRRSLVQQLSTGAHDLRRIVGQAEPQRQGLQQELQRAAQAVANAKANLIG
jgi:DNA-binding helix-hairpin-helix protein with protein kinase domain